MKVLPDSVADTAWQKCRVLLRVLPKHGQNLPCLLPPPPPLLLRNQVTNPDRAPKPPGPLPDLQAAAKRAFVAHPRQPWPP